MPSPEVVEQLCRNGVYAKAAAEIVVWRNDKTRARWLEVRARIAQAGTGRYYYDPDGEPLASTPAREFESSDLGRAQAQQRDALLRGLHEAEVTRCGTRWTRSLEAAMPVTAPAPSGTIVYQSFRTHDVPPWIEACMDSVRAWTRARGYDTASSTTPCSTPCPRGSGTR
jgi:hypothetical protein